VEVQANHVVSYKLLILQGSQLGRPREGLGGSSRKMPFKGPWEAGGAIFSVAVDL
jgi:hypothetical protein